MPSSLKRLVVISRPVYWIPAAAIYWWGVTSISHRIDLYALLGLFIFTLPMGVIVFGLNDIADREADMLNPRKGGVDGAVLKKSEVTFVRNWVIIFSLTSILIFAVGQRYLSALFTTSIVILAAMYSLPPTRLKTRPVIDAFSNGFILLFIFLTGLLVANGPPAPGAKIPNQITISFLAGLAFHSIGTVLDYDVDKMTGEKTIAIFLGRKVTLGAGATLLIACFLVGLWNLSIAIFFGLCAAFSLLLFLKPEDTERIKHLKVMFFYVLVILVPILFALDRLVTNKHP